MHSYVMSSGKYHHFDKTKTNGVGKQVADTDNQHLVDKHSKGRLLDRSRDDRRNGKLLPYDVGHYLSKPKSSKMDFLSGKQEAGPFEGANRDHVPSGESLNLNNGGGKNTLAYKEGLTVAIPNNTMHKTFSPTFGGRQGTKDKIDGKVKNRKTMDKEFPSLAAHRDIHTMLEKTGNKKLGTHALLDLGKTESRQTQIGAYRTLYRQNVKMNAVDPKRGVNPKAAAYDFVGSTNKKGRIGPYTNTKGSGQQGGKIAAMFTGQLAKTIK